MKIFKMQRIAPEKKNGRERQGSSGERNNGSIDPRLDPNCGSHSYSVAIRTPILAFRSPC